MPRPPRSLSSWPILSSLALFAAPAAARPAAGPQCSYDDHCGGAMICDAGVCKSQCRPGAARDCDAGEECIGREEPSMNSCAPIGARRPVQWTKVAAPGRVTQVAAAESGVVYVVTRPFASEKPTKQNPNPAPPAGAATLRWNGSTWTTLAGEISQIAAAGNGRLFGRDDKGTVHRLVGNQWVSLGGTLDDLAVDNFGNPVGTRNGAMWAHDGAGWYAVDTAGVAVKSLGFCAAHFTAADGTDACWWGVQPDGVVVMQKIMRARKQRTGIPAGKIYVSAYESGPAGFNKLPATRLTIKRIAARHWDAAWCVTTGNEIYQWSYGGWDRQPGAAIDVSVGSDGTVWTVGPTGDLYRGG